MSAARHVTPPSDFNQVTMCRNRAAAVRGIHTSFSDLSAATADGICGCRTRGNSLVQKLGRNVGIASKT
jgi:hypothetical protein